MCQLPISQNQRNISDLSPRAKSITFDEIIHILFQKYSFLALIKKFLPHFKFVVEFFLTSSNQSEDYQGNFFWMLSKLYAQFQKT